MKFKPKPLVFKVLELKRRASVDLGKKSWTVGEEGDFLLIDEDGEMQIVGQELFHKYFEPIKEK